MENEDLPHMGTKTYIVNIGLGVYIADNDGLTLKPVTEAKRYIGETGRKAAEKDIRECVKINPELVPKICRLK